MNEDRLRQWVRGQLSPTDRREVTRWVVLCTDPDLGPLLEGLTREFHEEQAQTRLRGFGAQWQALVDCWTALLDAGSAGLLGPGARPALASADRQAPWLTLAGASTGVRVTVGHSVGSFVALVLTDDQPQARLLRAPAPVATDPFTVDAPHPQAARPTLWGLRGAQLPQTADPLQLLLLALDDPHVEAVSIRWDPRDFD